MEAFDGYYRPVNVKQLVMTSVPEGATRVAMLERGEADIIYSVPGELVSRVQKLPGVTLAPGIPVWSNMGPLKSNHIQNGVLRTVTDSGRARTVVRPAPVRRAFARHRAGPR